MFAKYYTFVIFITFKLSFGQKEFAGIYDFSNIDLATTFNDALFNEIEARLSDAKLEAFLQLQGVFDDDAENRTACDTCKSIMTGLKGLVAVADWEETRDVLVTTCSVLMNNFTAGSADTDIVCPGRVDIRGPHVYEIFQPKYRKSPEDYCLNLNACFPPRKERFLEASNSNTVREPHIRNKNSGKTLQERKAEAITFVQLTDMHFEPDYAEGSATECGLSVCCQDKYGGKGEAWLYGEYTCNIPTRTMDLFLHKTAELNPAFIVYSGDTPPHTMWEQTYDSELNCTLIMLERMRAILGDYIVYPNLCNSEMFPSNLYSIEFQPYTQEMLNEFAEEWTDVAGFGEEQQETMRAGGYYTMLVQPGLRVLSFNSNYWSAFNWYTTLNEGRDEVENMKLFMRDTFQLAQENGEKLLLVAHHPPGGGEIIVSQTRVFEELIANYSDLIVAQVGGHTHYDHYRVFSDNVGNALAMTYISPSVTTNSNKNPSMRLYYLDPDTFELIDYEQYGFNLREAAGSAEPPVIEFVYSAVEEYGLEDMSPSSWQNLTERMRTDDELFGRYYQNFITRFNASATCEGRCRAHKICFNSFYSFDEIVYCVDEWEQGHGVNIPDKSRKPVDVKTSSEVSLFARLKELLNKAVGFFK